MDSGKLNVSMATFLNGSFLSDVAASGEGVNDFVMTLLLKSWTMGNGGGRSKKLCNVIYIRLLNSFILHNQDLLFL